ncbi:MAG: choice-of-anchor X domain-containing protein [Calditrichia bacterium]
MQIKKILILGLPALLFFTACEEDKMLGPAPAQFSVGELQGRTVVSSLSEKPVLFTVKVTHPQGSSGIESVQMTLQDSLGQVQDTVFLFDDGAVNHPSSGDAIAFDNIYSVEVVPQNRWGSVQGDYQLRVTAADARGNSLQNNPLSVQIFPNQAPAVTAVSFPDSIPAGMPATQISVTVNDPDGLSDVRWVLLKGLSIQDSSLQFSDTLYNPGGNSPVFSSTIDSGYGAGRQGEYILQVQAEDQVGELAQSVFQPLFIENGPPLLYSAQVPDTLQIPAGSDTTVLFIEIRVSDSQGPADLDSVYFDSYLPGGTPSQANPILLFDNGQSGDQTANDGIYTRAIVLLAGTSPGTYTFRFFGRDRVGHKTTGPVETVELVQ